MEGNDMEYGSKLAFAGLAMAAVLLIGGVAAAFEPTEGTWASGRDAQTKDMVFWLSTDRPPS
jgi:hypothetical protein